MTAPPNFKWGISTLGCHELDLPSICELAEKHAIHYLEIRSLADSLNLPAYLDETYPDAPEKVQGILDQYSQKIIALNSGFSLIKSEQEGREELLGFRSLGGVAEHSLRPRFRRWQHERAAFQKRHG